MKIRVFDAYDCVKESETLVAFRASGELPVEGTFILDPRNDPAAAVAMKLYAICDTTAPEVGEKILDQLKELGV
jgi:hypothetical protein